MIYMLQTIYNSVISCVRIKGWLSKFLTVIWGVKQGEALSALLFIFFINDMFVSHHDSSADLISIEELQFS